MKHLIAASAAVAVLAGTLAAPTEAEARTKDIVKYGAIGLGAVALSNAFSNQGYYPTSGYSYYGNPYGYYSAPSYGYYSSPSYGYSYGYPSYGSYYAPSYYGGYYY